MNDRIYSKLNNGVYKSGFATSQSAYEAAVIPLFETLDFLEDRLEKARFLTGDQPNEADWRLFPTLFRFDAVYVGHFKSDRKRIVDYPNPSHYAQNLYQWPGIAETVNMQHTRRNYDGSPESINPHRIVSIGPQHDWLAPHNRDRSF